MAIAFVVIAALAAFFGLVLRRPDEFRVERSARIDAPPERIYPHIADFHAWSAWSPYEKYDPTMTRTHGGAPSGTGAVYEWKGNAKVGQGRMEIVDTAAPTSVTVKLDFIKPFEAHHTAQFTLVPAGTATDVTWSMHGLSPFVTKAMGVFVNMDKMIGRDFERGLGSLKTLVQG